MSDPTFFSHRLRVAHLNPRGNTDFDLRPDADQRAAIAQELGLLGLPALHMTGRIRPEGSDAWLLTAQIDARVVQPCVVTLEPVETAISDNLRILYSPHATTPDEAETQIPDEDIEPLGQYIDAGAAMTEALSLALPLYPRAGDAALDPAPEPDQPEQEDRQRPFAGLADLLKPRD
ncbi:MAG: DUF177 domain-containing protein [Paracoccus sp. (in: a-proteobacteria)]|uniref:YceD family protein n=1 Tax=Paracoccus sp. TaxID=267 RepID=UPI0026E078D5|nr:DUF177 domain-containing protein [Paracoccus sp. (in: a-proteobacteria)]MDO5612114.1 DUF177 domain-containing protein [Paracoccus sp. (in: a-proteobacteria)]